MRYFTKFFFFLLSLSPIWAQGQIDTSLYQAILHNDLAAVKTVVEHGVPINATDENGANALMWAVYKGNLEMVKYLVEQGANIHQKGTVHLKNGGYYGNITGIAAGEGKLAILKYLIEELNLLVDEKEYNTEADMMNGWTPLQWGASMKKMEVVNYLIDQKADTIIAASELAAMYQQQKKYKRAIALLKSAQATVAQEQGVFSTSYASLLNSLGEAYYFTKNYKQAAPLFQEIIAITEKVSGKDNHFYAQSLNNLALMYKMLIKYEEAEPLYKEAIAIYEKIAAKNHPEYVTSLANLSDLYTVMGHYEKAEILCKEAIALREKVSGKDHPEYPNSLSSLANLYEKQGKYEEAEALYQEARVIRAKILGKHHPQYAFSLLYLANFYQKMGNYKETEALLIEAITVIEKIYGREDTSYANSLNSLANLYKIMGNYDKAASLYKEARAIYEKVVGKEHLDYATTTGNLAILYKIMGNYDKATSLYKTTLTIYERLVGKEHPYYVIYLGQLANLYTAKGKYKEAESLHKETIILIEKALGKNHISYARSLNNLAFLYKTTGNYEKSISLFQEAISIFEDVFGKDHPSYVALLGNLAMLNKLNGNYEDSENYLLTFFAKKKALVNRAFTFLSEVEKQKYLQKNFEANRKAIHSHTYDNKYTSIPLENLQYDLALFSKGLQLNISQATKSFIFQQADSTAKAAYYHLLSIQRRIVKEYEKPKPKRTNIEHLESQKESLEKQLARASAAFREELALSEITWQDIQSNLQQGEAAIEFVHFNYVNPNKTDSIIYAAAVLLPNTNQVHYISLFEEKDLGSALKNDNQRKAAYVEKLYSNTERGVPLRKKLNLYNLIWSPLDSLLSGINTVYYSPSGLLHRLNLGAIAIDEETNVVDKYQLINLSSTRLLALEQKEKNKSFTTYVVGGIKYDYDSTVIEPINTTINSSYSSVDSSYFGYVDRSLRGETWDYLKWTKKESSSIRDFLSQQGYTVQYAEGMNATEETFKQLGTRSKSPKVIHLATHGFFFPDPQDSLQSNEPIFKLSEHPMLRSGLLFAGANRVWSGEAASAQQEDGILTAMEISNLNLSNTELVVLSACETGLGDIQGSEGVYGLQRAFKKAGAKYLIMSLWQVPDRETSVFMTTFYKNWLQDKQSIPDAFNKTQKEMRDRFFNPYQWAGFILIE